jgi:ribonuclease HI
MYPMARWFVVTALISRSPCSLREATVSPARSTASIGCGIPLLIVNHVAIYTDGACSGNPGPGGWAAILVSGVHRKELSGGAPSTTNNRMELVAAIEALATLSASSAVDLYTDSVYLKSGITEWIDAWKRNGWRRRSGKRWLPVKNEDLWRRLDQLVSAHRVTFHWVAGHSGHAENERADRLARQAIPRGAEA